MASLFRMARSTDTGFTDEELIASQNTPINKIDEGVYIGNEEARRLVAEYNIGYVIRLTTEVEMAETRIDLPTGVKERIFFIVDDRSRLIEPIIRVCIDLIDEHLGTGAGVLVHCQAGISRSASVVIGLIMKSKKMKALDALKYVENRRPCVQPNPGFWRELTELTFDDEE
jgi:hypothetical protein